MGIEGIEPIDFSLIRTALLPLSYTPVCNLSSGTCTFLDYLVTVQQVGVEEFESP